MIFNWGYKPEFTIHPRYGKYLQESDKTTKITCSKCGYDKFYVGQGCCLTVVICQKCKFEEDIHDG